MLLTLQIRNFALIENATIEFGPRLNVLSGETGAGKSIIVQAIDLLLGGRGSADLIREGAEELEVSGLFERQGEEVAIRRLVSRAGKSRAFLDERPASLSSLESVGEGLVDLAGQHEHQILLRPERHLLLLDDFMGLEMERERGSYQGSFGRILQILTERGQLASREHEAREKEEFLRFQMKEISEARLGEGDEGGDEGGDEEGDGEEGRLQTERDVLKNAVRLGEICLKGEGQLASAEGAITDQLAQVQKEVQQAAAIDKGFEAIGSGLEEAICRIQEGATQLRQYGDRLSFDPERLQEVEDRLALIGRLKKKYGGSLESVIRKGREISDSLRLLDNFEDEIREKDREITSAGDELSRLDGIISDKRKRAAQELSRSIERELKDLGMATAAFLVKITPRGTGPVQIGRHFFDENGSETAEFLIAPNPGEGVRSLSRIASGGELSRIFLAIKKVLGELNEGSTVGSTCVFDEVDQGIGGGIADVVGRNLFFLAKKRQVLCITHLPQIACYADHHFVIQKRTSRGRTETNVQLLQRDERELEIARMLAGLTITEKAMAHAREMLRYGSDFHSRK